MASTPFPELKSRNFKLRRYTSWCAPRKVFSTISGGVANGDYRQKALPHTRTRVWGCGPDLGATRVAGFGIQCSFPEIARNSPPFWTAPECGIMSVVQASGRARPRCTPWSPAGSHGLHKRRKGIFLRIVIERGGGGKADKADIFPKRLVRSRSYSEAVAHSTIALGYPLGARSGSAFNHAL